MKNILHVIIISLFSLTVISCSSSSDSKTTTDNTTTDNTTTTSSGLFVAVGDNGTILTSTDATTWDNRSYETPIRLRAITYANSTFMTVGNLDEIILSSSDGITGV